MKKLFLILALLPVICFGQDIKIGGDVRYDFIHALAYGTGLTYTIDLTKNIPQKLSPTFTILESEGITFVPDSFTLLKLGDYKVEFSICATSNAGKDFKVSLRKNTADYKDSQLFFSPTGANDYQTSTWFWYIFNGAVGDKYSFWITGLTDNSDPTIKEIKVYVYKIPE